MLTQEEVIKVTTTDNFAAEQLSKRLLGFLRQLTLRHQYGFIDWSNALIEAIANEINALQGLFYVADHREEKLVLTGTFSIRSDQKPPLEVKFGDGLIGACAKTQRIKRVQASNEQAHCSGLTTIQPQELLLVPLIFNQITYGVLKLSHYQSFSDADIAFLEVIVPVLSAQVMSLVKEKEQRELTRQLQMREEKLLRIAEVSVEGILFVDLYNIITEANTAAARLLGYSDEELHGLRLRDIFLVEEMIANLTTADDIPPCETFAIRKDNSKLPVEIQAKRISYNGRVLRVISFRNISARVESRQRLEETQAELDQAQKIIMLNEKLEEQNRKIVSSINYARRIQHALLPAPSEMLKAFPKHFLLFMPRDIVSGDFYWLSRQPEWNFIALADCTGHGVPGALMSMIGMEMLSRIVNEQKEASPAVILEKLDQAIQQTIHQEESNLNDGMDIGICAFHKASNKLYYAGAKHNLLLFRSGEFREIIADRRSIGSRKHSGQPFQEHMINIEPNTMLYLCSDGYADQFGGEHNRKIGSRQVQELFRKMHTLDCIVQKNVLQNFLNKWKGGQRQIDDISIIGIRL
ncbi:SpoIIE family protein phosphatase [Rhodoflexus sp.]